MALTIHKPKPRKRRVIWTLIVLMALFLGYWLWRVATLPLLMGGGSPESSSVRRAKERAYATVAPLDEAGFTRITAENLNSWQLAFAEPLQDFDHYTALGPMRPTATRKVLVLQPIGPFDDEQKVLLADMAEFCAACFQLPVRIEQPLGLEINTKTRARRGNAVGGLQYNASEFIGQLNRRLPPDAAFYLGVTLADLWAGDLNFVFGQGSTDNRTGVYSMCRFFPEFSGRKRQAGDDQIGLRRSCQLLTHETGHLLGMGHCLFYKCVMNGANGLADADAAPLDFCPICHRKLLWNLGCDADKRFADLLRFYQKHALTQEEIWMRSRLENWGKLHESKP